MISAITSNSSFHKVVISTGNILNVNNQLGRKSSEEEVIDGLKLTLQNNSHVELNEPAGQVLRATQELNQKLTENERPEISIGAKIFLNKNSNTCIEQALDALLQILNVKHVDNVVLAYHPHSQEGNSMPESTSTANNVEAAKQTDLKLLWSSLEKYALQQKIIQLGISDLDFEMLRLLHADAAVKPTIAQINLSSCCVVPPELQEFCDKNDIQLLTHSDPDVLLHDEQFIIPDYTVDWALRYQVHVRCRGVLTAKGYILGASKIAAN